MQLQELTCQKEGLQLDYKQRISNPQKIAKTLCAFANTKGGKIIVGVSDQRKITGIDPEEELYQLEIAAHNFCRPPIAYSTLQLENVDELAVLVVTIPESQTKPHACQLPGHPWQVYIRLADKSIPADDKQVRNLSVLPTIPNTQYPELSKEEISILELVRTREKTSLQQVAKRLNFGKRRVRKLLTGLTNKGLIREFNHESQPFYAP